ncbi:MAG: hypothetical protein HQL66_03165 [Magnetococcales bacterium]|nr:hypothetical protein [Magnetococcales bacterium]
MHLTCPFCGSDAPWEIWQASADLKEIGELFARLPANVRDKVLFYMRFFHPEKNAPSHGRRKRLLKSIVDLVTSGQVRQGHQPPRPTTPEIWARAMAQMIAQGEQGKLKLPLASHNYLIAIAYAAADRAHADAEQAREERRRRPLREEPPAVTEESRGPLLELSYLYHRALSATIGLMRPDPALDLRLARVDNIYTRAQEAHGQDLERLLIEAREVMHADN